MLATTGLINWLANFPLLIYAWMYQPQIFWVCISLGLMVHVGFWLVDRWHERLFDVPTWFIVFSTVGLIYADRTAGFGSEEHAETVSSFLGLIIWWGTWGITAIALAILSGATYVLWGDLRRKSLKTLLFLSPGVFNVSTLGVGLALNKAELLSEFHFACLRERCF